MTLYGKAGMPPDVLAKLNGSVKKALQDPGACRRLRQIRPHTGPD